MALPPGWIRYETDDGKEYFHNEESNTTQWERPEWTGLAPDTMSFHSGTSEVYKPTSTDLELQDQVSGETAQMVRPEAAHPIQQMPQATAGVTAQGGRLSTSEETVSLRNAAEMEAGGAGGSAGQGGGSWGSNVGKSIFGAVGAMTSDEGPGITGFAGSLLTYAQQFFDVSSDDVVKRLQLALLPYPSKPGGPSSDFRTRPDFWGPFWVATTAILFFAASSNFARMLYTGEDTSFEADYAIVREAAGMIYGLLMGVPLVTRVALYCTGQEADTIDFKQMICVYGYSLTPTIPVSVLCLVPLEVFRWLAIFGGMAMSMLFLREHLWTDLAVQAPTLKTKIFGLFALSQFVIFVVYRVHFF